MTMIKRFKEFMMAINGWEIDRIFDDHGQDCKDSFLTNINNGELYRFFDDHGQKL